MIDPRTVGVFIPTYDHKIQAEMAGFLVSCAGRFFSQVSFTGGISSPELARILCTETFLSTDLEWMVCIDSDIIASPSDFQILMQPFIPDGREDMSTADAIDMEVENTPTRIECAGLAYNMELIGRPNPERAQIRIHADALVIAEYSYKNDDLRPCRPGLGFARIHRSVFERIRALKDANGGPIAPQCLYGGKLMTNFYPGGSTLGYIVPNAMWKGEDVAFVMMAALAGITPRYETRTRLWHVGTKAYPYQGGDISGAN